MESTFSYDFGLKVDNRIAYFPFFMVPSWCLYLHFGQLLFSFAWRPEKGQKG